jgi:UDP-N-acetyl-D-glucosamine dehydrogenase
MLEAGNPLGLKVARTLEQSPASTSPSRPSAKIPATTPSPATTFPRSWAAAARRLGVGLGPLRLHLPPRRPVSSPSVAEMTKLLENIYRCVNIALVNELKQLCMRMGIDIHEVIDAAKTKPFGFQAFYPGPGLGGHCIPIDPFYLSWKAKEFDFRTRFIELAGEINTAMPYFVIEQIAAGAQRTAQIHQGIEDSGLGLAYKRDIDDLRESPSLTIIELLREKGAIVAYNDPYFPTVGHGRHYDLNMTNTPLDNLAQYDAVVIVTDHSSYDYRPSSSSRSWSSTPATPPRASIRRRLCVADNNPGRASALLPL